MIGLTSARECSNAACPRHPQRTILPLMQSMGAKNACIRLAESEKHRKFTGKNGQLQAAVHSLHV